MPTKIECMDLLLAAHVRCLRTVRCRRWRRDHLYGSGQVLGSLMRHLRGLAPIEVCLLAGGMVDPARLALLIPPPGGT